MNAESVAGPHAPARALAAGRVLVLRFAVVGILSLLGAIVFVRELGTAAWASYSVAYFVTVLVDQTLGSRLFGALVRSDASPPRQLLRASVTLAHLLGLAVLVACVVAGLLLNANSELPDILMLLTAAGACSYVYATRSVATALLERELRFGRIVTTEVLDQVIFYAISVPWVLSGGGLEGVAAALAARGVLPALVLLKWRPIPRPGLADRDALRPVLRFLAPTLGAAVLPVSEVAIPTLALAGRPEELAYFMTGGSIVSYAAVLAFIAQRTSFAGLEIARRSVREVGTLVRGVADLNALVLTVMVVPFCALSWLWYPAVLGSSWSRAADVLVVMSAGFIFGGIVQVVLGALYSIDAPGVALRLHAATAAVFTALMLGLVGPLPHLAAPLALGLARAVAVFLAYRAARYRGLAIGFPGPVLIVVAVVGAGWAHLAAAQRDDTLAASFAGALGILVLVGAVLATRPLIRSALTALRAQEELSDAPQVVHATTQPR